MADYIETIPQEQFNMKTYRSGSLESKECDSIGCVIGHCIILDSRPIDDFPKLIDNYIGYSKWSEKFTKLSRYSPEWSWCFSSDWEGVDNTPEGAAKRIRYLVNHGLPENHREQRLGIVPLTY